ncbi:unnamed protein product [Phytophthora fragariaefolia]|uniref:Unnamed protein product n=1 Tax=Phytophthora fragariaefolia TaxID=1490495 RepID=A0A9W6UA95_9STRA|nr:unnamed protein product [Phytophthora fragariaefolia]
MNAYAQRARDLVSNIVTNPIDEATKVVTFMKSLIDGPVMPYLFLQTQPSGGPKPMDLSSAAAAGSQQRRGSTNVGVETTVTSPVGAQPRAGVTIPGITTGNKKRRRPADAGPPAGDAVERADIGHAV